MASNYTISYNPFDGCFNSWLYWNRSTFALTARHWNQQQMHSKSKNHSLLSRWWKHYRKHYFMIFQIQNLLWNYRRFFFCDWLCEIIWSSPNCWSFISIKSELAFFEIYISQISKKKYLKLLLLNKIIDSQLFISIFQIYCLGPTFERD